MLTVAQHPTYQGPKRNKTGSRQNHQASPLLPDCDVHGLLLRPPWLLHPMVRVLQPGGKFQHTEALLCSLTPMLVPLAPVFELGHVGSSQLEPADVSEET